MTPLPGIWDQTSYDALASRVVSGHGFSFAERHWPATAGNEPTAHWSYPYTLFLAAVYAVCGHQPLIARVIQALASGILHPWLTWRVSKSIFGQRVGLIAAGICALYVYFFYYAGALITETFYFLGILWTFDVMLRLHRVAAPAGKLHWKMWLEFGFAVVLTGMMRQVFLVCSPMLFAWLWISRLRENPDGHRLSTVRYLLQGTASAGLIIVLTILPWTIRNFRAFNTFIPLNTNAGFAFYWGNHPIYGTHFLGLLPGGWEAYTNLIPSELRQLNEAEMDKALLKRGLETVKSDPVRFFWLSLSRSREYFKFWPSSDSGLLSNICRFASFGLSLPLMICGIWISIRMLRINTSFDVRSTEIVLLLSFVAAYSAIHLTSWALIRYRLPIDIILIIFAALCLDKLTVRTKLRIPVATTCRTPS